MKQLIQDLKSGKTYLEDVPVPTVRPSYVLIKNHVSLVSPGTEKMLVEFGRASYIEKARQQPEKVKQVINKIKSDGLRPTVDAVFRKLNEPIPLGYSAAGEVVAVGEGITSISIGDRLISNGHHAEYVCVPEHLTSHIPEDVTYEEAAFTVLGAIALQGIRLLQPELGNTVVVTGLGLIGLLACQLLQANGCHVIAFDIDQGRVDLAQSLGIDAHTAMNPVSMLQAKTNGIGADAILITASSSSDQIISQSAQMCRQRGKIVLLGVVGLDINRSDFYEKEISFQVSCSYGPGRYQTAYEEKGMDYPIGFVRWTEQRNFQAVLKIIAQEKLQVKALITNNEPFEHYQSVYDNLSQSIASILRYDINKPAEPTIQYKQASFTGSKGIIGIIGAGNFTNAVVCPMLSKANATIKYIVSADGLNAARLAKKHSISHASSSFETVIADQDVDALVITTRHNLHAQQVIAGLKHNKHVFVEKPLCLHQTELEDILKAYHDSDSSLTVGFNRRFAPLTQSLKAELSQAPMNIIMTVNAGDLPADHWTKDPDVGGGRLLGEVCHFVDLAVHITENYVERVLMSHAQSTDNIILNLEFKNKSTCAIHYFPTGHKSLAKERIEVHQLGQSMILNNFKSLTYHGINKSKQNKSQDKGHAEQFKLFKHMLESGGQAIIPIGEIIHTSQVLFSAIESAQQAKWISID